MTIQLFEQYALVIGIGGLIAYMLYIIYRIGEASNAGRYGFMVLFIALGLGFVGVILKFILIESMAI